jgi:hypothetical protein
VISVQLSLGSVKCPSLEVLDSSNISKKYQFCALLGSSCGYVDLLYSIAAIGNGNGSSHLQTLRLRLGCKRKATAQSCQNFHRHPLQTRLEAKR